MNKGRRIIKLKLIRQHRQEYHERTLDKLIAGEAKPEDVTLRFKKLKDVRK